MQWTRAHRSLVLLTSFWITCAIQGHDAVAGAKIIPSSPLSSSNVNGTQLIPTSTPVLPTSVRQKSPLVPSTPKGLRTSSVSPTARGNASTLKLNKVSLSTPTKAQQRPTTIPVCEDKNKRCDYWSRKYCYGHLKRYMKDICRKSCGFCGKQCRDNHPACVWARVRPKLCQRVSWKTHCRRSCRIC